MPAKNEIYPNAPIIEAVFEIRFPAELSIKCHVDDFHKKIKKEFPLITAHPYGRFHLFEFTNEKNTEIIKVGVDRVSYHSKMYDEGFVEFRDNALNKLNSFVGMYKISEIIRTGLRYVNHIPIIKVDGCIPVEKYLNFGYETVESIPKKFELLNTILQIKINEGKLKILIQYKEIDNMTKSEILVLDFDYYMVGKLKASKMLEYVTNSHKHTKKIFEDLISTDYRKVMRGKE